MRNWNINREGHTDWRSDREAEGYEHWRRHLRDETEASNFCFFPNCFCNSSNSCFTKSSDSISSLPFIHKTQIGILIEVVFLQIVIKTWNSEALWVLVFRVLIFFIYFRKRFLLEGENQKRLSPTDELTGIWMNLPIFSATSFQQKIELIWTIFTLIFIKYI